MCNMRELSDDSLATVKSQARKSEPSRFTCALASALKVRFQRADGFRAESTLTNGLRLGIRRPFASLRPRSATTYVWPSRKFFAGWISSRRSFAALAFESSSAQIGQRLPVFSSTTRIGAFFAVYREMSE